jgi:hypothetical protein
MSVCFPDQVGHLKDASNKAHNAELKLFLEVYLPNPVLLATYLVVFLQNICSLMPLIPDIAAAKSSKLCNCFCLQRIIPFSTLLFAGPSRHRDQLFPWRKPRRMSCYFSSCTIQRKKSCGKGFSLLSHLCFTQWCI